MRVSKPAEIVAVGEGVEKPGIPMYPDVEVINVDTFELEDTLQRPPKTSANLCEGYALPFPDGQSPHDSYPFALHSQLELPWDYSVRNGRMTLFARSCTQLVKDDVDSCHACRNLFKTRH
jgi:hypothetical protein